MLLARTGGTPRALPPTFNEEPNLVGWSGDSTRIIFSEAKKTRVALYAMPVDGQPKILYEPDKGIVGSAALNVTGTYVGFSRESPDEAPEAFLMGATGPAKAVRVSRANLDLPKLPLGETKVISWKSKDGAEIEGLLTLPVGYEPGKRYSLILNIHGGPAGVFNENFIGRLAIYPLATFSARGYAVLRPNPRGSGGYGKQFRFANVGDWGGKDYEDDMAGVDRVIALGIADPDRTAVMGWSYGGFMTSWIITQTNRFKAAAVGAGVTNLWSFTGTADIPGFLPDYFGGEPWEVFEAFRKHSPMSFVQNVKTPTLILHGEADVRVPTSQGYELYNALKRQGVTTKMVVYPRTPHGPREPKFILDIAQRHSDWVDKYVR
jgi:dipeptidyl aminopeptidase/acylaminoacyl peptidase